MQRTLDFWKRKCDGEGEAKEEIISTQLEVQGRKTQSYPKDRPASITKRKGKASKFSQIQGQSNITSFLSPTNISRTPSISQNSSIENIEDTMVVGLRDSFLVGKKTTEATNETGGQTNSCKDDKFKI